MENSILKGNICFGPHKDSKPNMGVCVVWSHQHDSCSQCSFFGTHPLQLIKGSHQEHSAENTHII
jgi:hypothetical protein